jgi:GMP synthase (glutamine-hydrolysing)
MHELVLIVDFGSQYTQLIARRIREENVYCEIISPELSIEEIKAKKPRAIILSGGPNSIFEKDAPQISSQLFDLAIPILGICYGLQLIARHFGGEVEADQSKEYGRQSIQFKNKSQIFSNVNSGSLVWMSHGDHVSKVPKTFLKLAVSNDGLIAGIAHQAKPIFGVQFHPEVNHTEDGQIIISNFLFKIASFSRDWTPASFVDEEIISIRNKVGKENVILGLSGGVDSSVLAFLLHRAIGEQLFPIFINNGLLRKNEVDEVLKFFEKSHINVIQRDYSKEFLTALAGVSEPEQKRKIIGRIFIEAFETEAKKIKNPGFLAQGTLYPDVIESGAIGKYSVTIKSHHNVGGLPEKMSLKILEPFRGLFKDEVRKVGKILNVPDIMIKRHPFPGPGLAVRCLGEILPERLDILRNVDQVFIAYLKKTGWYDKIWQAFAIILPLQTVGVKGDQRSYENVIALRAVHSSDGMTADWVRIPPEMLAEISTQIINKVPGVNRVVYDITSKPPGTIEWE